MRHSHTKSIKEEIKETERFCKDICELNLSEIKVLNELAKIKIGISLDQDKYRWSSVFSETFEYLEEYIGRLSNRTLDFKQ